METTSVKTNSEVKKKSLKTKVQKFGTSLSGMIMPNISSLIAWGLITAIFMASDWFLKKFDQLFREKVKTGFEMLYDSFSSGIMRMLLAIFGLFIVNPLVVAGNNIISKGVDWIISIHLLPLANIFIEPAKVLFLNNAVGNGILVPLGIQQAAASGTLY